jgi:hypothetical protein
VAQPDRNPESAGIAGFRDVEEMSAATERLRRTLESDEPLSRRDWRRVVVLTELIFGSDTFGALLLPLRARGSTTPSAYLGVFAELDSRRGLWKA